jgi:hypothetical protein
MPTQRVRQGRPRPGGRGGGCGRGHRCGGGGRCGGGRAVDQALVEQPGDGVDGAQGGHRGAGEVGEFDHGGEQDVQFHGPAALDVVQGGGAVVAGALGAGQPPVDGDGGADAQPGGDVQGLGHHGAGQGAGGAVAAYLRHRGAGQGAEGVEGDVAHQLHPDVLAQVGLDRALETAGHHRGLEVAAALGDGPVRLADGEPGALQVPDGPRRGDLGGGVDDAADRPLDGDGPADGTAGVDGVHPAARQRPVETVEVPPGDAVLRGDDGGVRSEQRAQQRPAVGVVLGLEPQEDEVDGADLGRVGGGVGPRGEVAARAGDAHPVGAQGLQMGASGDQVDVGAASVQCRTRVGADRAGAQNGYAHERSLLSANR